MEIGGRGKISLSLACFVFLVGLSGSVGAQLADSAWPMFHQNLNHTGQSPYVGAQTNNVKWSYTTGATVSSSPAVGADDTVYVGANDNKLYAFGGPRTLTVCSSGCNYNSIQAAINAANNGDTIQVQNGTYNENVDVNKSVNLVGAGADVTIVNASNPNDHVFNVSNVNSVNISGFTATGATGIDKAGIYISNANTAKISNNSVLNNFFGVYGTISSNNIITDNTISSNSNAGIELNSGCVDNNISNNNVSSNLAGIYLHTNCNSNTISNNNVSSNSNINIYIYENSNYNYIQNNNASSANYGIHIHRNSNNNDISGNDASYNSNYGIWVDDNSSNNTVANNTASSNDDGIVIEYSSNSNTLTNNTASSNNQYGIYLRSSSTNTIANNTASNNNWEGIYLEESSSNTVTNNTAKENNGYDIYVLAHLDPHCNNLIENNTVSGYWPLKYFNYSVSLQNEILSALILCNADNSSINNVTIEGSVTKKNNGLFVIRTDYSNFTNIDSSNNSIGIDVHQSSYSIIANNTASNNNGYGVYLGFSSNNNTITNDTISNNNGGIFLHSLSDNIIYNNFFNNTNNFDFGTTNNNSWNTTKTAGTNIIGGPYLGGNFWANPSGTGFSETCTDADSDGICNSIYTLASGNVDYLPLAVVPVSPLPAPSNYTQAAEKAGIWVASQAISEGGGYKWSYYGAAGGGPFHGSSYVFGGAGIGSFYIELYNKTGNTTYLNYAKNATQWIITQAVSASGGYKWAHPDDDNPAWYLTPLTSGAAGVGNFLINMYRVTGNATYLSYAEGAARWMLASAVSSNGGYYVRYGPDQFPNHRFNGFHNGQPGVGAFLWRLYNASSNTTYRDYSVGIANYLINTGAAENGGYKWVSEPTYESSNYYIGARAGTAGVAIFFYEFYENTGNATYLNYANGAVQWILSQSVISGNGAKWPYKQGDTTYYLVDSPAMPSTYPTIGDILLRAYSITGNSTYLDYAEKQANWMIGQAVFDGGGYKFPTQEGSSSYSANQNSMIFAFLKSLYNTTGNSTYNQYADGAFNWTVNNATVENNGYKWPTGNPYQVYPTWFNGGASGIGYYLLVGEGVSAEQDTSGLVAEYHFDGNANDSSGNGNDGTVYGATFVGGISGQALSFDNGAKVTAPDSESLSVTGPLTLEAWIYPADFGVYPTHINPQIVRKYVATTGRRGYAFEIANHPDNYGKLEFTIVDIFENGNTIHSASIIPLNQWTHAVAVWDGFEQRLYINGVFDASNLTTIAAIRDNTEPLYIGYYDSRTYFKGNIDEVRIYNRALSADEILSHYQTYTSDTTLPIITITSPQNTTYTSTSVDLNVSADEPIDTWWYSLDGGANVTFTPNTTVAGILGSNKIMVYANDTSGNMNYSTVDFTIDLPPEITVASPTNTTYNTSTVDINVSANEQIDSWWYNFNYDSNTMFTPNTSISGIIGSNKIVVYANDSFGNINLSIVYFTLTISETNVTQNITEGNLTIIDLKNESYLQVELMPNSNATLNLTAESSTNATLLNVTDLTAAYGLGERQNSLNRFTSVNVSGIANNESDIKWVILRLYYEDSDLDKNGDGKLGPGDVKEETLEMYWYCYSCTGNKKWFKVTTGNTLVAKGGPEVYDTGINTTENYIWSNLSHFSTYGVGGEVIPPEITITSPQNTTYNTSNISLNVSASGNISNWWYSLDGGENITFVPNITLTGLLIGQHYITVYANDTAGNTNSSTVYFTVDTTPPEIVIYSPQNKTYNASSVGLNFSATDLSGTDWMGYSLDGAPNVTVSNWRNNSWSRRKQINISEQSDNTLTNYPVFVNVSHDSDMQPDFDDLRFTYFANGTETEIEYWIEDKIDSYYAEIWLNVTEIPALGDAIVYMYYGNPVATQNSNGEALGFYDFDDDDEGFTYYQSGSNYINWNSGTGRVDFQKYRSGSSYATKPLFNSNVGYRMDVMVTITGKTGPGGNGDEPFVHWGLSNNDIGFSDNIKCSDCILNVIYGPQVHFQIYNSSSPLADEIYYMQSISTTYKLELTYLANGTSYAGIYDVNGNLLGQSSLREGSLSNLQKFGLLDLDQATNGGLHIDGWFDDVLIRKYVSPEPTTSTGSEEFGPGTKTTVDWAGEITGLSKGQHYVTVWANDSAGNIGSANVSFTIAPVTFNISLIFGWNLISIPLEQDNWNITSVLAPIEGNYSVVFAYIDGIWEKSTATRDPLTDMDLEQGYWIYMTAPDTLELSGTVPSATTINISTGWNLVGYPSFTTRNITDVLSGINYTVVFAYIDDVWEKSTAARDPLTEMTTGLGYWIYANEAGSYEVEN